MCSRIEQNWTEFSELVNEYLLRISGFIRWSPQATSNSNLRQWNNQTWVAEYLCDVIWIKIQVKTSILPGCTNTYPMSETQCSIRQNLRAKSGAHLGCIYDLETVLCNVIWTKIQVKTSSWLECIFVYWWWSANLKIVVTWWYWSVRHCHLYKECWQHFLHLIPFFLSPFLHCSLLDTFISYT